MTDQKPVAIVGIGAIMPDALNAKLFWENILKGHYSVTDVPADRWSTKLYYDNDPKAPDKTYSKIGAWVTNFEFNPIQMRIPIPPTVIAQMDFTQQWGIAASHQALTDYGYPQRSIDPERMAVILGNANAGERHYRSTMRILLPEYVQALAQSDAFKNLPAAVQQQLIGNMENNIRGLIPDITEDTMSGELSNIIAGRIANVFNFSGPNFVTDAACASSLSALQAAVQGLNDYQFDSVLTGGVDRNMGPESFVKFSKIGALSADGSRPYADGANGFVMGEGTAVLMLKRLADAEREGDKIYAVVRGIGSSSDGKGKGITAPNPLGQTRAIERAWKNAGVTPASAGLIEGHGTSTRVGDVVEVNSLNEIFGKFGLSSGSIALGSVKSNIGHLKGAAGAAGMAKVALALHEKMLPPSINFHKPNPNIDFEHMPFFVNTTAQPWEKPVGEIRRAGVSSFGFGGTNFHVVMEEYVPGFYEERQPVYSIPAVTSKSVDAVITSAPVNSFDGNQVENQAVKEFVLAAVSEKTGYPVEMLDVELDMEADLGVDTVKQAELFRTIRENFGIPRREDLRLSDYNTLEKVIAFVMENAGTQPTSDSIEPSLVTTSNTIEATNTNTHSPTGQISDEEISKFVIQQVAEKTGYPAEMLDLDLDLEADLGVDTVKQAELFASIRTHYGVARREDLRLSDYNTLAKVIGFFKENAIGQIASTTQVEEKVEVSSAVQADTTQSPSPTTHFRGLHFLSANSTSELQEKLRNSLQQATQGSLPPSKLPDADQLTLPERLVFDYGDNNEFIKRAEKALKAFDSDNPSMWQAMTAQGVYRGSGSPGKVAFLFPGQGSQYVNMLRELRAIEPVVDAVFVEADRVMTPLLGKPLTDFIYADGDEESLKAAELKLKDTTITQPAVLTANVALLRLLEKYGFKPDVVIGHSLGEYAALVAAGVLRFDEALEIVSARGREMVKVSMEDNGCMAAVSAPLHEVERMLETIDEYVVLANINSPVQSVIAGSTKGVDLAIEAFMAANFQAVKIPVSHAFHTKIVAPASIPLRKVIDRMDLQSPKIPVAANVTGDWYPQEREAILNMLAEQVASPVQFIKGAQKLYDYGARIFVEVGPKRVMNALTSDIFKDNPAVTLLATNHPRKGALNSFNEALCALYSAGLPVVAEQIQVSAITPTTVDAISQPVITEGRVPLTGSVVISGAGLGLPGKNGLVFAEDNVQRLLKGEVLIESFPQLTRENMIDKRVTRLVKHEAGALMVNIDDLEATVKLAGQSGAFDPAAEFGIPEDRVDATDISTQLAIAAGIDALHDAGIPLVMNYRTTSKGTLLPNRWMLPEALRDETGVIFASAFPGLDRMAEEADNFYKFQGLLNQKQQFVDLLNSINGSDGAITQIIRQKVELLDAELQANDYHFHRHFVFRVLAMGHSQFAEHIGARGPNTYVNAACATTTHAVSIAEDWIRAGRCRRVVVIAGDDVTSGHLVNWIGTGLMASGAATTEGDVRMAALPFDRRRNGMIMGMGAAALVVEAEDAVRERGMRGICEVLSSQIANSAFHGTRLDVPHVGEVMNRVMSQAEQRFGINRHEIAARTAFVSHETYTPARGGSAAAEIHALRNTFGDQANKVIIANTKGFTGHTMGVGVEDVMAVKLLEYGIVPPIANYDKDFQPDPELGDLNLSHGGDYPVEFSLRLGAGFGSQIAMTLMRKVAGVGERMDQSRYQKWLAAVSGYAQPDLEVVQHNLRIKHVGAPQFKPLVSNWQFGQGPQGWAKDAPAPVAAIATIAPAVRTSEPLPIVETIVVSTSLPTVSTSNNEVSTFVLERVSEKTGYPTEMLDLDLDLEADLGIDTVKQAELFASIREHFGIPRREDLRLSDYNTLAKVMQFVLDAQEQLNPTQNASQPVSIEEPALVLAPTTADNLVNGEVTNFVLSKVSEKTGYPTEMLDLDLDLEADLGIDTVKQAELFASIREHFGIPRREDLRLSDYNTLTKVVQFVLDSLEQQKPITEVETEPVQVPDTSTDAEYKANFKRRIPVAVLRPRLDLCTSTGIALDKNSRVIVVSDSGKTSPALEKKLQEREVEVLVLKTAENSEWINQINHWSEAGNIDGLYFLPTLRKEKTIAGMTQGDWNNTLETKFYNLVAALRQLQTLKFLVVATRFDGLHGLSTNGAVNPLSGAAAGFAKAIARERKDILVKVVDFSESEKPTSLAIKLVEETLFDQAVMEVAWEGDQRFTLVLRETVIDMSVNNPIPQEAVFIVSGGTGGITAPIVQDLALHTKGHFYLMARTRLPDKDNSELELLANDPEQLKFVILQRLSKSGQKATPAIINQEIAGLERAAGTLKTMDAIREAGGQATYLPCDVTDVESVREVVRLIMEKEQRVDVLIHAAGVEKSRKLESKSEQEFRQIVDVKATGFFNLFKALETAESLPKAIVNFGSVAGRFGNSGQTDYSAANDLLSRLSSAFRHQYPEIQVMTIDWGAWAEVGMASRGHIPELMRRAGIEMLHPDEAASLVRKELEAGSRGEVILAGSLGLLESQSDPAGGMDIEKANQALTSGQPIHVMLSRAAAFSLQDGIILEVELDPSQEAFLKDHSMNGIPLLPGVMGIEGFSVAAQHIASTLGAAKGGFHVSRLENIQFLTPFKFYRNEARKITWKAQVVYEQDGLVAYVTLESDLARVNQKTDHMLHFSGEVHLIPANKPLEKPKSKAPHWNGSYTLQAEDIYKLYFHGPAFQVLEGVQKNGETVLGKLNKEIPPLMESDKKLVSVPILVELCLQTAGVWDIGKDGSLSLPQSIGALRLFENKVNGLAIFAEVLPVTEANGNRYFNARVIDSKGQIYLEIDQYRTSLLPYGVEKELLIPIEALIK
jgi:acyl transferase domain-containing protein/NAD(P)-dependent dehydrogenase (short-subunit alcohol dehydrogenase family)/acyl carrier protein